MESRTGTQSEIKIMASAWGGNGVFIYRINMGRQCPAVQINIKNAQHGCVCSHDFGVDSISVGLLVIDGRVGSPVELGSVGRCREGQTDGLLCAWCMSHHDALTPTPLPHMLLQDKQLSAEFTLRVLKQEIPICYWRLFLGSMIYVDGKMTCCYFPKDIEVYLSNRTDIFGGCGQDYGWVSFSLGRTGPFV